MTDLKRDPIKYLRDRLKRDYKSKDHCFICKSKENLELHHIYSLAELFAVWTKKNNIDPKSLDVDSIMGLREKFYEDCYKELNNDNLYTLCKEHHQRLHHIYGQRYLNIQAKKVKKWLLIQQEKECGSV